MQLLQICYVVYVFSCVMYGQQDADYSVSPFRQELIKSHQLKQP